MSILTIQELFASKWTSFCFKIRFVLSVLSHLFVSNNKIHDDEKIENLEVIRFLRQTFYDFFDDYLGLCY